MKIEDIEITFGKSVLVEKTQRMDFLRLVDSLCEDVLGSFLHCNITGTGWATIIRYSDIKTVTEENYCLLRIILFKDTKTEQIHIDESHLRVFMCDHSYREQSYIAEELGIFLADSCPLICHKETLPALILEIMSNLIEIISWKNFNLSFVLSDMTVPFAFCNKPSHCGGLYGLTNVLISTGEDVIYPLHFKTLFKKTNQWKKNLKRKGRRALKKN